MSCELQKKWTVEIGTFELTSDRLVVCDPGYDLEAVTERESGVILASCRTGSWRAEVTMKQFDLPVWPFCGELRAIHTNFPAPAPLFPGTANLDWEKQEGYVGVDSGQAGLYDFAHFRDASHLPPAIETTIGKSDPAGPRDLWYLYCCGLTLSERQAGVLPFGVVSSAGKGDGGYGFSVARDTIGKIIGVSIEFVDDLGNG